MILNNIQAYEVSLEALRLHKMGIGRDFKGRFIQIFLALKYHQNNVPSIYSGKFIASSVIQSMLDDVYEKGSMPAERCVLSLFENSYLARTGIIPSGNTSPQNTWRNNLNIQKGIGCYAPPADLSSITFLEQERISCKYLQPAELGTLADGRCGLCSSGGRYRSEAHRKWLRIDPGGNGYAVTDMQLISNFSPYVAPRGQRLPIFPLMYALYFDASIGTSLGDRERLTFLDFLTDFNFSKEEANAYFECSTSAAGNAAVLEVLDVDIASFFSVKNNMDSCEITTSSRGGKAGLVKESLPQIPEWGTVTAPPQENSGWGAEKFVEKALYENGWAVSLVSRQQLGYDILAKKKGRTIHVEVKSSLGSCSPSLTSREWERANYYKERYILAVVENYNEINQNTIYWIPDPSSNCFASSYTTLSYTIPRSSWINFTCPLSEI